MKKILTLWALGTFAIIMVCVGITFAFFNYTRTGESNIVKTGDIFFETDYESTTLENVVPIQKENVLNDTENVLVINVNIKGHTTYKNGVDYVIKAKDVNSTVNDRNLPISANITSNVPDIQIRNYEDENVIVENAVFAQGTILPSHGNVDGVLTIRAYINDENITISDTLADADFTTDEWNSFETNGLSFKIKVQAWEHEETLYDVMLTNAVMDNISSEYVASDTGIDFSQNSSDENGKGLYIRSGTENNSYPIVYYRGDVKDNNVVFGGLCWKAVRTTETGGVKLIYNGKPQKKYERANILGQNQYTVSGQTDAFTYDENDKSYNISSLVELDYYRLIFNFQTGVYEMEIQARAPENGAGIFGIAINGEIVVIEETVFAGTSVNINAPLGYITENDYVEFLVFTEANGGEFKIKIYENTDKVVSNYCNNSGNNQVIETDNGLENVYNNSSNSMAYSGYMYNKIYEYKSVNSIDNNIYFGNNFIYENGVYTLTSPAVGISNTRHYSCNNTNSAGNCTTIRYYYYYNINTYRYIELSNGKSVEDAINEMLYDDDVNKTDSNIKMDIEKWFQNNLINVSDKLEDTVWCNDRSMPTEGERSFYETGWNSNGGNLENAYMYYNTSDRLNNIKVPNLSCQNVTDRFNVSNSKASTKYSVGLLTSDEVMLAGGGNSSGGDYVRFYLLGGYYWTMSPSYSSYYGYYTYANVNSIDSSGSISYATSDDNYMIRPSISLAFGATIKDGDGTAGNPYEISNY